MQTAPLTLKVAVDQRLDQIWSAGEELLELLGDRISVEQRTQITAAKCRIVDQVRAYWLTNTERKLAPRPEADVRPRSTWLDDGNAADTRDNAVAVLAYLKRAEKARHDDEISELEAFGRHLVFGGIADALEAMPLHSSDDTGGDSDPDDAEDSEPALPPAAASLAPL